MIDKIKSVKDIVHSMLVRFPETRDNDRLLIVYVWCVQNPNLKPEGFYFRNFASEFIHGNYADTESVRRSRQKLQELHPELRGKSYSTRHEILEPEVRQNIQTLF